MVALVTVMYGPNPLYELELFGSVLSALSLDSSESIDVTVFTDRPRDHFPLPINVVQFDQDEWNEWTYNGAATHFVKMHVMLNMLRERQCPVLYFDTDVIFLQSPVELAKNTITAHSTLMHANEGPICNHLLWDHVTERVKNNPSAFSQPITPQSLMYNSGIMGMLPEHALYMERAIKLAQELYAFEPIFSIDQFATATVMSSFSELKTCEAQVLHYWGWRRKFVHATLETIRSEWLASNNKHRPDFESLPHLPNTHLLDILTARLRYFFHREDDNSRFAYLAYLSAKRIGAKNQKMSQAWLTTCLESINNSLNASCDSHNKPRYYINDLSYLFNLIQNTPIWLNNQNVEEIRKIENRLLTHQLK